MSRHVPLLLALVLLLAVVGSLVYLIRRTQNLDAAFDRFIQERKLSILPIRPTEVGPPFVYPDLRTCLAYQGPLSPRDVSSPIWAITLGSRQRAGTMGGWSLQLC